MNSRLITTFVAIAAATTIACDTRADVAPGAAGTNAPVATASVAPAKYREYVIPNGTALAVNLETAVDSQTSHLHDVVTATLIDPVHVDGVEVLPAGSVLSGEVTSVQPSRNVKGRAHLAVRFDSVSVYSESYPISAAFSAQAPSTRGKDTAKIAIPAAGGAIIGALLGGGKGAAAGAAIGGGAGTAVVLSTKGKPVVFRRGADLRLRLAAPVQVRVPL